MTIDEFRDILLKCSRDCGKFLEHRATFMVGQYKATIKDEMIQRGYKTTFSLNMGSNKIIAVFWDEGHNIYAKWINKPTAADIVKLKLLV